MPWQIADLARHTPIADHICNKAVLLITRGGRNYRFLTDTDLAPWDKLCATHFVGVARPAILICLRPHNVDHRPPQSLGKEGSIDNRTGNNRNTTIGGCSDDVVLLSAHHIRRPGSGCRSTPCQNLIPARIHGAAVRTGEVLPSSVGGGAVPALPCDLAERRWHFDFLGGGFVCGFVLELLGKKEKTITKTHPVVISCHW
jgi:hypothetical protein